MINRNFAPSNPNYLRSTLALRAAGAIALAATLTGCAHAAPKTLSETTVMVPAVEADSGQTPAKNTVLAVCKASPGLIERADLPVGTDRVALDNTCDDAARDLLSDEDGKDLTRQTINVSVVSGGWPQEGPRLVARLPQVEH